MFEDRKDAGRQLAVAVERLLDRDAGGWVAAGVPRGGVPLAAEVADELDISLCPVNAVKVRPPWNRELAIGAVAEGDICLTQEQLLNNVGIDESDFERAAVKAQEKLKQRIETYGRAADIVNDQGVVLVDDGAATGLTAKAAARALRRVECRKLVIALPVASEDAAQMLQDECDKMLVLHTPRMFMAVSQFYRSFPPVGEKEVLKYLRDRE